MEQGSQSAGVFDYVIAGTGADGSIAASRLSKCVDHETFPDARVNTDDEILHRARQYCASARHLIGTAQMGPRSVSTAAAIDNQRRVHGLENLRFADVSVMPSMPSANTYAATMMRAEKASDMIGDKQSVRELMDGITGGGVNRQAAKQNTYFVLDMKSK